MAEIDLNWGAVSGISAAAVALVTVTGAVAAMVVRPFKKLRGEIQTVSERIDMVATEGREAHREIGERIQVAADRLNDRIDKLGDRVDGVRRELGDRIDKLDDRIEDVRRTAQDTARDVGELKGTLSQIEKRLGERSRPS